jgi:hypothetical protein
MKAAMVYGDLTSDSTSEQYPTEVFCDDCFEEASKIDDDGESSIINEVTYDSSLGQECSRCGDTEELES